MTRRISTINLGNGAGVRYRVVIEDDPSIDEISKRMRRKLFLKELIDNDNTGILECQNVPFDSFKLTHDGMKWTLILEAVDNSARPKL